MGMAGWLLLFALGNSPANEALQKGRAEAAALHYDVALAYAEKGLISGTADVAALTQLHALRGQVLASTGHTEDATDAYARALALTPSLALPTGSSPRLRAVLVEARKRLGPTPLSFSLQTKAISAQAAQTTLEVHGDVLHLVARAELTHADVVTPFAPTTPMLATWPCEHGPCPFHVRVLDEHGNELRALGTTDAPLLAPAYLEPKPTRVVVAAAPVQRSFFAKPWPYWVLGGVAAGVGTYFAVSFSHEQAALQRGITNPATPATSLTQLDAERRRDQIGTMVSFGAAGALGVTGLALVF